MIQAVPVGRKGVGHEQATITSCLHRKNLVKLLLDYGCQSLRVFNLYFIFK